MVRENEGYLWPDAVTPEHREAVAESEVQKIYPHRQSIPLELWSKLLLSAEERIDVLVLAGLFLAEDPAFARILKQKASEGVSVRMLFGDPEAAEATKRSIEERLATGTVPARIRNALAFVESLAETSGIEIRFHETTLYNSVFRFDEEMIVNMHVFGLPGAHAPAMHLRRLPHGDLFDTYMTSFEHVWQTTEPVEFFRSAT
ncbi:XRE family transcriptional regulator [Nocardia brasiliensis]|uniref:XRE family transcriptional regulator n=1 Tax=Nocardia brasiliensis TaxID=37326 RepID=UPI00245681DC|nr:XRE family transcriptional regulator [Nocardia brasiliensis]